MTLTRQIPRITLVLLVLVAASLLMRALGDTTGLLVVSSVLMLACCVSSAVHVLGARAALRFVLIAPAPAAAVAPRAIAVFAMGIPLLAALCGWSRWQRPGTRLAGEA
jgi:hypothetical protein